VLAGAVDILAMVGEVQQKPFGVVAAYRLIRLDTT
jgi:hypothetical protein